MSEVDSSMLVTELRALAKHYAYATECNLATLEELEGVKSTSKSRLTRQRNICAGMVAVCNAFRERIELHRYPRIWDAILSQGYAK